MSIIMSLIRGITYKKLVQICFVSYPFTKLILCSKSIGRKCWWSWMCSLFSLLIFFQFVGGYWSDAWIFNYGRTTQRKTQKVTVFWSEDNLPTNYKLMNYELLIFRVFSLFVTALQSFNPLSRNYGGYDGFFVFLAERLRVLFFWSIVL